MKGKSLAFTILSVVVLAIGSYSGYFTESVQAWLGIVSMAAVLVLSTFFPSGELVKGWNLVMILTNATMIAVQLFNATADKGLMSPELANGLIMGINIFIQVLLKDYSGTKATGSIMEKKLV